MRDIENVKAERWSCEDRLVTKCIKLFNPDVQELQKKIFKQKITNETCGSAYAGVPIQPKTRGKF